MSEGTVDTGIPTRALHEAYLSLEEAHRTFRQARAQDDSVRRSQLEFQDRVLTFYELMRPHLKTEPGLQRFWDGKLADYPDRPHPTVDGAARFFAEEGVAVWGTQQSRRTVPLPDELGHQLANGEQPSLEEIDDAVGLQDNQRLAAARVAEDGSALSLTVITGVMGLRALDEWGVREETVTEEKESGFLAGKTTTKTIKKPMPADHLTDAKRLLCEAADEMSVLVPADADGDRRRRTPVPGGD